jgi:hypothetical protein
MAGAIRQSVEGMGLLNFGASFSCSEEAIVDNIKLRSYDQDCYKWGVRT